MRILFTRHRVRVYRFLLRFLANGSTAEDLVSEVFLDVWRQAPEFQGPSQVGTWFLAIVRNKALSTLRRPPTLALDHDAAAIEEPANNPELTMQNRQQSEIVRKCVTKLSPAHREIVDLVYYHEKSINEAAEIIGVPQNTVKTRMFYARKQIADLMAAQGISPGIV
jgi:RNA polymerase sigma-70 factor (ECF subfamily)